MLNPNPNHVLPPLNLLDDPDTGFIATQETAARQQAATIEQALRDLNIQAQIVEINTGPIITMHELSIPPGTRIAEITALNDDIARALAATSVRIIAPLPGKTTIGIEVPNATREKVRLKELLQLAGQDTPSKLAIPLFLGKDANGEPLVADLATMPHCLISGLPGSGRSMCLNSILMSLIYTQDPDHLKLALFDPSAALSPFKHIPHLLCPITTEADKAAALLAWACEKMDERYGILNEAVVRDLAGFNKLTHDDLYERFDAQTDEEKARVPKHLPYIVIIIAELADLILANGKEVGASILRLAQHARAVGIHLILATQHPTPTVITDLIKACIPCKIAFRLSRPASDILLDRSGAERLLGEGDMLYLPAQTAKPVRALGTYVSDGEIRDAASFVCIAAS